MNFIILDANNDPMIKFFRKIRFDLMEKNKPASPAGRTGKYFKYAISEIALVVIGTLIALQINNVNEKNKTREKEVLYLNKKTRSYNVKIHPNYFYLFSDFN